MTKSMMAAAIAFASLTMAAAAQAKMAACPSPEVTENAGTRSQTCKPSDDGECGPRRTLKNGVCGPISVNMSNSKVNTAPEAARGGKASRCPAPEKIVNAGTRSEYCMPMGRQCGPKRVLTKSSLYNKYVCQAVIKKS
jgi:hypothetical protein